MYHALYRKYRPINFDSVVGQNSIIKTLRNSVKNGTFSHAYMFFGPRGTGKTTISKILARNINCLNNINGDSCGVCKNCLASYNKECVDIIEIDAASNNGVDEIRELKNKISLVPAELKYKVYIIDEVHMLSIGAFNALLKTLEEPPSHAIFILATTDPQKVPETIVSRCQCFSFKRISNEMIVERLKYVCSEEKIDIDEEVLDEIAVSSDGGMRDSLGMLDKLSSYSSDFITLDDFAELNGMITKNELNEFIDAIFSFKIPIVLSKIQEYNTCGKNLIQIISQLMYYLRNIIVDFYILNKKVKYNIDTMQDLVININEKMFDIKKSGNPKLYIEMFFVKFIRKYDLNDSQKTVGKDVFVENNSVSLEKNLILNNNSKEFVSNDKNIELTNVNVSNSVSDIDSCVKNIDVVSIENSVVNSDNNFNDESFKKIPRVLNIDDIISVRVNNTFAEANKELLKNELNLFEKLNDFTFDQEIGYIVCNLLDAKIRAVSSNNIIMSYEYDSTVKQNLIDIEQISYVYNKITNSNKKLAIISDNTWENEKNKYISNIKEGKKYYVLDEPEEILEDLVNDDIMVSSAVKLFGDIVEID